MNDTLSKNELKSLRQRVADREARTEKKATNLLAKGKDLTSSEIKWLLGKEVGRKRIAKAIGMSFETFNRYLAEQGLIISTRQKTKEDEDMTTNKTKIQEHYDKQIEELKNKLSEYEKAYESQRQKSFELSDELREEKSKVREREKMLEQLNRNVQDLIQERDILMQNDHIKKQHDLLLEYIKLGV